MIDIAKRIKGKCLCFMKVQVPCMYCQAYAEIIRLRANRGASNELFNGPGTAEGGSAPGAHGLERQGDVHLPGARFHLRCEPAAATWDFARGYAGAVPAAHRYENRGWSVRALGGEPERSPGGGLADSVALAQKAAELEDQVHKLVRALDIYQARIGSLISTLNQVATITNKELDHEPV